MAALDKLFIREFERNDGSVLTINQCEVGDVGCVVWDAALVLTSYLDGIDFLDDVGGNKLTGKTVVELGAGTGIVGLQAAAIGYLFVFNNFDTLLVICLLDTLTLKNVE